EDGADLYVRATDMKLEGIVSKMANAPYRSGRCEHWLKVKCWRRDRFVVVGFVPEGSAGILKLRLARREGGALIYAGRVGTGWDHKTKAAASALSAAAGFAASRARAPPGQRGSGGLRPYPAR